MIRKFTEFWIKNGKITVIFMIIFMIWWIFSWLVIPKQYNPDIIVPAFNIIVPAPWYNAKEVENLIVKPLENKLMEIEWVEHVYWVAHADRGAVMVSFYVWTDKEKATTRLYNKIFANIDLSPLGVQKPIIKPIDPDDIPIYTFAITKDNLNVCSWVIYSGCKTDIDLRKVAVDVLDKIKYVENTSVFYLVWWENDNINIKLDLDKLEAKHIDIMQVWQALKKNNIVFPWWEIRNDKEKEILQVDWNLNDINKVANLIVWYYNGSPVYLKDVALIYKGITKKKYFTFYQPSLKYSTYNTWIFKDAIFIGVAKKRGTNAVFVVNDLKEKLKEIQNDLPKWFKIVEIQNEWKTAKEATDMLLINLIESIIIVFFVLWIYLGIKDAFNNAMAIPLTLAWTIGLALILGDNINRITLFALILVLWMLVDNWTVVVENITRHLEMRTKSGKTTLQAILDAVDEVWVWVILSTITRILAFIAMFFVTWMMGQYMGPIPKYAIITLTLSLLVAFSVNPFLSYVFAKRPEIKEEKKDCAKDLVCEVEDVAKHWLHEVKRTWIEKKYLQIMRSLLGDENKVKRKIFKLAFWSLLFAVIIVPPSLGIFKARMLPKSNKEQIYIWIDTPRSRSIYQTMKVSQDLGKFLSCFTYSGQKTDFCSSLYKILKISDEETKSLSIIKWVAWWVGIAPVPDFANTFRSSMMRNWEQYISTRVNLISVDKRDISSEQFTIAIRPYLKKYLLAKYPDIKVRLLEDPPGPPVRATFMLRVQTESEVDYSKLEKLADWLYKKLLPIFKTHQVVDVYTSKEHYQTKWIIKLDHELITRLGLNVEQIAYTIYNFFGWWVKVSLYHDSNTKEPINIVIAGLDSQTKDIDTLKKIYFTNKQWKQIPLLEIAKIIPVAYDKTIYDDDRYQTVYIYWEMGDNSVVYPVINIYKEFLDPAFWEGNYKLLRWGPYWFWIQDTKTGEKYRLRWWGEWKLTMDTFRDLGIAMIIAILAIYLLMVAQFRSFAIGGIIMLTFLLGFFGVFPGFTILYLLKNEYFSSTSMIWVIALAGIVVGNAIILLEYLNVLLKRGLTLKTALLEAGVTRLRPIILTSLTTVLWATTILGDPVWSWLAWSIIWGLSVSAVLTLIVVPVFLYDTMKKAK